MNPPRLCGDGGRGGGQSRSITLIVAIHIIDGHVRMIIATKLAFFPQKIYVE